MSTKTVLPTLTLNNGVEMARIAAMDRGQSLFFDHRDPESASWLGNVRF
jgi:hypothetical protein